MFARYIIAKEKDFDHSIKRNINKACNVPLHNWMTPSKVKETNKETMWPYDHLIIPIPITLNDSGRVMFNKDRMEISDAELIEALNQMNDFEPSPTVILDFANHPDCQRQDEIRRLIDANYNCGDTRCYEGSSDGYMSY